MLKIDLKEYRNPIYMGPELFIPTFIVLLFLGQITLTIDLSQWGWLSPLYFAIVIPYFVWVLLQNFKNYNFLNWIFYKTSLKNLVKHSATAFLVGSVSSALLEAIDYVIITLHLAPEVDITVSLCSKLNCFLTAFIFGMQPLMALTAAAHKRFIEKFFPQDSSSRVLDLVFGLESLCLDFLLVSNLDAVPLGNMFIDDIRLRLEAWMFFYLLNWRIYMFFVKILVPARYHSSMAVTLTVLMFGVNLLGLLEVFEFQILRAVIALKLGLWGEEAQPELRNPSRVKVVIFLIYSFLAIIFTSFELKGNKNELTAHFRDAAPCSLTEWVSGAKFSSKVAPYAANLNWISYMKRSKVTETDNEPRKFSRETLQLLLQRTCPICVEDFSIRKKIVFLPSKKHVYHSSCYYKEVLHARRQAK